jgi:membrane-associated phospholipid phosphatase
MPRLRSSEWLLVGYFTYAAVAGTFFGLSWKPWTLLAVVLAVILVLSRTSILRNVAPVFYTLTAYREMNWFTRAAHDHHLEQAWIVWDRRLLHEFHLQRTIEGQGALFPAYFELCYVLVYVVAPVSIALLFAYDRRERMDRFWLAYLAGTLGVYALFPYFPSEPPRTAFPGTDLPHVVTVIREFNLWIVGGYGIHSSVFPSAHVSAALSAAWGLMATLPERPWIGRIMAIYGVSVAIATIYGRYHYAVDGLAGIVVSLLAVAALKLSKRYSD